MGNKILYLECYSGISGDMTVSSLLDLGGNQERLIEILDSLKIKGYELKIGRRAKCGIDSAFFDVILDSEKNAHSIDHHHENAHHEHGHHHEEHDHHHEDAHHEHGHTHNHHEDDHHDHLHSHDHAIAHTHTHNRNIHDINEIIAQSSMTEGAKAIAYKTFQVLAQAESKAHGLSIDEVHFHEVGAVDSIVDIAAAAILIDDLKVNQVVVSSLYEGTGHVWCQHGVIPVPVPATLNIVTDHGINLKITDNEGEMVTPTGAALVAALRTGESLPEHYRIIRVGIGSGKKNFKKANILRAYLVEEQVNELKDEIHLLETNVDDTTGETLGYAMEKLMASGARDVYYTPIFMKKNRPGYQLSVLCKEEDVKKMEDIIFSTTTSIGIRKTRMERTVLKRRMLTVKTQYGEVRVKAAMHSGVEYFTPEYEDLREILKREEVSYKALHEKVMVEISKLK